MVSMTKSFDVIVTHIVRDCDIHRNAHTYNHLTASHLVSLPSYTHNEACANCSGSHGYLHSYTHAHWPTPPVVCLELSLSLTWVPLIVLWRPVGYVLFKFCIRSDPSVHGQRLPLKCRPSLCLQSTKHSLGNLYILRLSQHGPLHCLPLCQSRSVCLTMGRKTSLPSSLRISIHVVAVSALPCSIMLDAVGRRYTIGVSSRCVFEPGYCAKHIIPLIPEAVFVRAH